MSDGSGQKDPSLEEILGSIRRIISEDSAQGGVPEARAATPDEDEDVLDLTDEVLEESAEEGRREPIFGASSVAAAAEAADEETASPRREPVLGRGRDAGADQGPAEGAGSEGIGEPPAEIAEPEPEPEVAHDTIVAHGDDEPRLEGVAAAPKAGSTPPETGAAETAEPGDAEGEDHAPEEEEAMTMMSDEPTEAPPPASAPKPSADALVSDSASSATTAALGELNRAMAEKGSRMKVGEGDATISEMVRELLRPMLREWLDENLPAIVERVVKREIQKLVDHTEDDD